MSFTCSWDTLIISYLEHVGGSLLMQSGSHDKRPTFPLFMQVHLWEQSSLMKVSPTLKLPLVNLQSKTNRRKFRRSQIFISEFTKVSNWYYFQTSTPATFLERISVFTFTWFYMIFWEFHKNLFLRTG